MVMLVVVLAFGCGSKSDKQSVTFPKMYVGETNEEVEYFTSGLLDSEGNQLEFEKNSDGSVTVYEKKEALDEAKAELKKSFDEGMSDLGEFMKIETNDDMSEISIFADEMMVDFFDDDTASASLYHVGMLYQIFSGEKDPTVEINLYKMSDKTLIKKIEIDPAVIEDMAKDFSQW